MIKYKRYIYLLLNLLLVALVLLWYSDYRRAARERASRLMVVRTADATQFECDMVQCYASAQGKTIVWIEAESLSKAVALLTEGNADILLRLMPLTTELKEQLLVSYPIAKTRLLLVQNRANALVRGCQKLDGDTLYIEEQSPYRLRLSNMMEETGLEHLSVVESLLSATQLVDEVAQGNIRMTVYDEFSYHMLTPSPLLDASTYLSAHCLLGWCIAPEAQELKSDMDEWLRAFTSSVEYRDLIRMYYR